MNIATHIFQTKQRIYNAEIKFNRAENPVKLLAVSKGHDSAKIEAAIAQGLMCFGENYVQEAIIKIHALKHYNIEWHFLGNIQNNKTKLIAKHFTWVHSINNLKTAQRLNNQRPSNLPALNVCIEVNITKSFNKSGILLEDVSLLAEAIQALPNLKLRGLMTILEPLHDDFAQQRIYYHQLQQTFIALQQQSFTVDTLSMGMSDDLEAAIAEGATIVRVGTAIFGKRL